jgi:FkbM family methyltransferase
MTRRQVTKMSVGRFLRKCVTDYPAAVRSAKLVARDYYGRWYWRRRYEPLAYHLPTGGVLLLEPGHAFTGCFWPDVDRYEPEVCAFLRRVLKPGATFIDCGANVGYFSVQAGDLVGQSGTVVSIEANPDTYKLLDRNLRANNFGTAIHCALTSQGEEVELFVPGSWDVYSSLRAASIVEGVPDHSYKVRARKLDEVVEELGLGRVDLVKIDVEGGELDVLNSATKLLAKFRPFIVMEYGSNTWSAFDATPESLKLLARETGYAINLFHPQEQKLVRATDDVWGQAYINLILTPEERAEGYAAQ